MAIFDYQGYQQALSEAEDQRAAAVAARNKLRSDLQAKGVTSWRSTPEYQALTNQINQANTTVVALKRGGAPDPDGAIDIDFGNNPVPTAATDSRTRLELQAASQPPASQKTVIGPSQGTFTGAPPAGLSLEEQVEYLRQDGELATTRTVDFPPGSTGNQTTYTSTTPTGGTRTDTYTSSASTTSIPAKTEQTTVITNPAVAGFKMPGDPGYVAPASNATTEQRNRDGYLTTQNYIAQTQELLIDPDVSAADKAELRAQLEDAQGDLAYWKAQPGALGSPTVTVNSTDNTTGSAFTTSTPPTDNSQPIASPYTTGDADVDAYQTATKASIEQKLADREAYETGVEGEYDYYENPADDPNLFYDDSLGEYVPRTDRPEDWQARDQNEFVYDDNLGEWVRREDMPDNWNYDGQPVTEDPQYDDFGCLIGVEEYDDDSGTCIPIGGRADQGTNAPSPILNQYGCISGQEYYDSDQGVCVPFGAQEQQAWDNGCDVNSEYWDPDLLACISREEGPPRLEPANAGELDGFGCIIGEEEYDDETGVCVPIGTAGQLRLGDEAAAEEVPPPPLSIRDKRKQNNSNYDEADWRFKIRLSPYSEYLYNDPDMHRNGQGILAPLQSTDGVIFPYMPQITVPHTANYSNYTLTHSNYRGYFYQGSQVGDIIVNGTFTAQDTNEANYLLAVIHFFRSATKMFYGQDNERGTPPPLLYMSGLGDFQFAEHPCVLSNFNYTIPDTVDYVRAYETAVSNVGLFQGRRSAAANSSWSSTFSRLLSSALESGAPNTIDNFVDPTYQGAVKISGGATYVPTTINIQLVLLPVQTRDAVSNKFSLKDYATGNLIKKGFW